MDIDREAVQGGEGLGKGWGRGGEGVDVFVDSTYPDRNGKMPGIAVS